jgi:NAD+ synthase (glutamine-hydrolysing)
VATLRIALAQSVPASATSGRTPRRSSRRGGRPRRQGRTSSSLPELALVGYPPDDLLLRPSLVGRADAALSALAQDGPAARARSRSSGGPSGDRARGVAEPWGVAGAVPDLANRAAVLRDGRIDGTYDKMRLPNEGVFDEARYFVPGDAPLVTDVAGVRFGTVICQDLWTADGPVERTVEPVRRWSLVLNASPYHRGKRREREEWVTRHAREYGVWVCYVNRVGGQDEVVFDGDSMVADPRDASSRAGHSSPPTSCSSTSTSLTGGAVIPEAAHAPARALGHVDELWHALVLATRDYCRGNGFREAIVGLSGGIDSAVTAAIAVEALGADAVLGVAMPSPYSSSHSVEDALALAKHLGIRIETLPIGPTLAAAASTLEGLVVTGYDGEQQAGIAYENLQSRLRGLLLMALSNERGAIVLTTGNKSEYAVGYATLYGDMAGGFAPLKDVLKGDVYALAHHANRDGERIPVSTITKPPSAELRPGQVDADSLPDYPRLDADPDRARRGAQGRGAAGRRGPRPRGGRPGHAPGRPRGAQASAVRTGAEGLPTRVRPGA